MKTWKELDIKNKIAYGSAIAAFICGWGLTIAGFIVGSGVISDSVLWVLGQSLVYAASVFGVGMYVSSEVKNLKTQIKDYLENQREEE